MSRGARAIGHSAGGLGLATSVLGGLDLGERALRPRVAIPRIVNARAAVMPWLVTRNPSEESIKKVAGFSFSAWH